MHPSLGAALTVIEKAAGRLDTDTLVRPMPGKWSIAEILEHLTLAFTANARGLEKILRSGELRARAPKLSQRLGRVLVVDVGYFPRVKAPDMTLPHGTIPPDRSLVAVRDAITTLDATLARVADRFGDNVRVANHPYFAGLTVRQWRKFHWRHTVHHMRQVRKRVTGSYR